MSCKMFSREFIPPGGDNQRKRNFFPEMPSPVSGVFFLFSGTTGDFTQT